MDENDNNSKFLYKIAITGQMGSGKSTLVKIINEFDENAYISSFSSQIRKIIKEVNLPITRKILQKTGDFFRGFNDVVWVDMLLNESKSKNTSLIIDGIRYKFERDKLVKNGFIIIKMESHENLRRERISKRDKISISDEIWTEWTSHPTENFIKEIECDYSLDNNYTIEILTEKIKSILDNIRNIG